MAKPRGKGKSTVIWELWDTDREQFVASMLLSPKRAREHNRDFRANGIPQQLRAFDWDKAIAGVKAK